jgi:hypothetical protein
MDGLKRFVDVRVLQQALGDCSTRKIDRLIEDERERREKLAAEGLSTEWVPGDFPQVVRFGKRRLFDVDQINSFVERLKRDEALNQPRRLACEGARSEEALAKRREQHARETGPRPEPQLRRKPGRPPKAQAALSGAR